MRPFPLTLSLPPLARRVFLCGVLWASVVTLGAALPTPSDAAARTRLGLHPEAETFELDDIGGDRAVLLMFDLYCPTCQQSARNFGTLISRLESEHPGVTVLGIGCGDTAFETARFVEKFHLPIPAVPDHERSMSPRFSLTKTPSVVVVERSAEGRFEPLYRHSGYFGLEHLDAVLQTLRENPPAP